jgi:hypothetical protein
VVLVPLGGSVGNGSRFGDPTVLGSRPAWDKRLTLPARLTELHPSAALQKQFPGSADQWQVVIGALPTTENDTADALVLTYTVDGQTRTIVGRHSVAIARTEANCNKATGG